MSTFIGNIEAKADVKGRIFIPASYRKQLPEGERERLVMRIDPNNACLILYPEGVWNRKVADFKEKLDEWNSDDQMLLMQFVSDAEWLDIDSQGRVLISKRYFQQIGASQEVLFVGMLDRIALWDKVTYQRSCLSSDDFAKRLAEKMMKKNID
ncbi:MAG TPA: cell division/cell wall cluster transcriptional repressor MraZ [Paludibacteraceae bacterium]|jgi:MraZ protein|nr:cell division/cell wall cluster transcriptional repressor MraZ [Paludibacteraceae bacterium]HQB68529.1 cell division/cell wall cluster transcriptional repressor MraZ [Paludibacteraceae bacterium]HRS67030.1 cell division/cell wall cluster transcriptional repressor MraZ [Paludibacteraceae bacterium]